MGERRYGWISYGVSRTFALLQSIGLHVWVVYVRALEPDFKIPPEHAARYEFRRVTLEEALAQSRSNPKLDMSQAFLKSAFDRGDLCLGAFDDGQLVAYSWRTFDRAPVKDNLWLKPLHSDCCYGYKALVLPDYRGQRLNKTVRSFYEHQMVAMGVKRIVGYIDLHNLRSMRAHERWRQDKVGIAGYFGRNRMWATFRTPRVREYLMFTRQQAP